MRRTATAPRILREAIDWFRFNMDGEYLRGNAAPHSRLKPRLG